MAVLGTQLRSAAYAQDVKKTPAGLQKVMTSLRPRNPGEGRSVNTIWETREETLLPGIIRDLHQGNTGAGTVGGRLIVTTNFAPVTVGPTILRWKAS